MLFQSVNATLTQGLDSWYQSRSRPKPFYETFEKVSAKKKINLSRPRVSVLVSTQNRYRSRSIPPIFCSDFQVKRKKVQ
jgi:hypothetical protein